MNKKISDSLLNGVKLTFNLFVILSIFIFILALILDFERMMFGFIVPMFMCGFVPFLIIFGFIIIMPKNNCNKNPNNQNEWFYFFWW